MSKIDFDKLGEIFMIGSIILIIVSFIGLIYNSTNYTHSIHLWGHIILLAGLLSLFFSMVCMILDKIITKT